MLEPQLGVLLLVFGCLQEEGGNLLIAVLLGHGGVVGVLIAGHRLAGEGGFEILLSACASILIASGRRIGLGSDLHEV